MIAFGPASGLAWTEREAQAGGKEAGSGWGGGPRLIGGGVEGVFRTALDGGAVVCSGRRSWEERGRWCLVYIQAGRRAPSLWAGIDYQHKLFAPLIQP